MLFSQNLELRTIISTKMHEDPSAIKYCKHLILKTARVNEWPMVAIT